MPSPMRSRQIIRFYTGLPASLNREIYLQRAALFFPTLLAPFRCGKTILGCILFFKRWGYPNVTYSYASHKNSFDPPTSYLSETFLRSSSRVRGPFTVGDHVRIKSLRFERTPRSLGEIEEKTGQWAGEALGSESGEAQNDGT